MSPHQASQHKVKQPSPRTLRPIGLLGDNKMDKQIMRANSPKMAAAGSDANQSSFSKASNPNAAKARGLTPKSVAQ